VGSLWPLQRCMRLARQRGARMCMPASSWRAVRGPRAHPPAARPGSSDARPCTAAPLARVFCSEIVRLVRKGSPPTQGSVWFILNRLSTCAPGARASGSGRSASPRRRPGSVRRAMSRHVQHGSELHRCHLAGRKPRGSRERVPHAPAWPHQPNRQVPGRDPTGFRPSGAAPVRPET